MTIKAIDIVLVPPKEVIDLCLQVNAKAKSLGKSFFTLSQNDFIPHISLTLGCVEEASIPLITEKLRKLSEEQLALNLELTGLKTYTKANGDKTVYFEVKISDELRELHESSIKIAKPYLVSCSDASVLVEGEKTGIAESSFNILNNYVEDYAFENYHAHISIGSFDFEEKESVVSNEKFPLSFKASTLSLFQVGNRCTCREKLFSMNLPTN